LKSTGQLVRTYLADSAPPGSAEVLIAELGRAARVDVGAHSPIRRIDTETRAVIAAGTLSYPRSDAGVGVIGNHPWPIGGESSGPLAPLDSVVAIRAIP